MDVIVHSPVMVDVFGYLVGRIIRVKVPIIKISRRSGDEPWFDEL